MLCCHNIHFVSATCIFFLFPRWCIQTVWILVRKNKESLIHCCKRPESIPPPGGFAAGAQGQLSNSVAKGCLVLAGDTLPGNAAVRLQPGLTAGLWELLSAGALVLWPCLSYSSRCIAAMAVLGRGPTDLVPDLQTEVAVWSQLGPITTDLPSCHCAVSDLVSVTEPANSLSWLDLRPALSMWSVWQSGLRAAPGCHPQICPAPFTGGWWDKSWLVRSLPSWPRDPLGSWLPVPHGAAGPCCVMTTGFCVHVSVCPQTNKQVCFPLSKIGLIV